MKQKLVIIGAGMASGRMLEALFELDHDKYEITLFGAEPHGNYNRIMLSPLLAGDKTFDEIVTHDAEWYREHGVNCRFGETVVKIDRSQKKVISSGGATPYDKLVIATGSASFIIPVSGNDLPGVIGFRDLSDVNTMLEAATKPKGNAVIIGGGLLGLEAAAALSARGMSVTVLHLMGHLMERQLDPAAGHLLQKELEDRGVKVVCKAYTKAFLGHEHVDAVLMEDGTIHDADLVVMAAGIRPETRIAIEAALHVERGIVVDDTMVTSDPDIFALGECVEHERVVYGLVAPLFDMAEVLARTLIGEPAKFVAPSVSTKLKVTGVDLFSVGDFAEGEGREDIVFRDPAQGIYKRLLLENDRLIGIVMFGDTDNSNWFFSKLKTGENISKIRDTLIFGPAFHAAPLAASQAKNSATAPCSGGLVA